MKHLRTLSFLPLILITALLVGCDDDTGTEPGDNTLDFDPWELVGVIEDVVSPLDASEGPSTTLSLIILQLGLADLGSDGTIPAEYLGTTLAYSQADQEWAIDETRTDGPQDGVRVLWYTMDPGGSVASPLNELGHIDITSAEVDGMDVLHLEYVRSAGDAILAELVHDIRVTEDGGSRVRELSLEGTYRAGQDVSDVSLTATDSLHEASATQFYGYDLAVSGPAGTYLWEIAGTTDTDTDAFDEQIDITVEQGGVATVLSLLTEGVDVEDGALDGAGTITRGGELVADVAVDDGQLAFTGSDGERFTAQADSDLQNVTLSMMLEGAFVVASILPVILSL